MKKLKLYLKNWYLNFIEKKKRNFLELLFFYFLRCLSFLYGLSIALRNFLYNKKILKSYSFKAKIISIGNICWAGSGKTPLTIGLHKILSKNFKTAILRRGYGSDEESILKEETKNVFSNPNRCQVVEKEQKNFDLFILDDGFQHRRLQRDIDIVIMGAREFNKRQYLIPAYIFREPITSLKRADFLILNYAKQISKANEIKKQIKVINPEIKIYWANYKILNFKNLLGQECDKDYLKNKKVAAFCAIGYPEGFFNKLNEERIILLEKITYPDHYKLDTIEFDKIQNRLLKAGIDYLVITKKDKYHLPETEFKINICIANIEMIIEDRENFIHEITNKIT